MSKSKSQPVSIDPANVVDEGEVLQGQVVGGIPGYTYHYAAADSEGEGRSRIAKARTKGFIPVEEAGGPHAACYVEGCFAPYGALMVVKDDDPKFVRAEAAWAKRHNDALGMMAKKANVDLSVRKR